MRNNAWSGGGGNKVDEKVDSDGQVKPTLQ